MMQKTSSNKKKTHFSESNFRICLLGSKNSYFSLALVAFFWPAKTRQKQGKQKVIAWWWSRWRFSSRVLKGGTVLCLKNKKRLTTISIRGTNLRKKRAKWQTICWQLANFESIQKTKLLSFGSADFSEPCSFLFRSLSFFFNSKEKENVKTWTNSNKKNR